MPTEIKICGLSDEEGVETALEAGADFVGFVFFPPSPRSLPVERAAPLMHRARGKARLVALMVNPDERLLDDVVATLAPDFLQLHGKEPPQRVAEIKSRTKTPVIKAVGIGAADDLRLVERYSDVADRFLLDAKAPKDATRPGGNAAAFDWNVLKDFSSPKPWLLAGGLTPENVTAALAKTGAGAVDVSSGVESAPGRKDAALIRAFVRAVRDFDRAADRMAS